jgi:hypothetical protein
MATKNKRRLFETDLQMEMTLKRAVDLYVKPKGGEVADSLISDPPREEVVDRVIKKVRKL